MMDDDLPFLPEVEEALTVVPEQDPESHDDETDLAVEDLPGDGAVEP